MVIGKSQVMVTCKKCGQQAPADSFRLDYEYKMVVCPNCYNRRPSQTVARPGIQNIADKPKQNSSLQAANSQVASRTPIRNTPFADDRGFKAANQAWKEKEDAERSALFGSGNSRLKNTPFYDDSQNNSGNARSQSVGSVPLKNSPKAGWDRDDEFLELDMLKKKEDSTKFQPASTRLPQSSVVGQDVIAVKCYFCNYTFKYNTVKQSPRLCPNCGKAVDNSMF